MIPYEIFGQACERMIQKCPGCSNDFGVKTGVAYLTSFMFGGEPRYAYLTFCSTKCLLIWFPKEELCRA